MSPAKPERVAFGIGGEESRYAIQHFNAVGLASGGITACYVSCSQVGPADPFSIRPRPGGGM